jgi:hypothetical protein
MLSESKPPRHTDGEVMTPSFPHLNAWTAIAQDAACSALAFASVVPPLLPRISTSPLSLTGK